MKTWTKCGGFLLAAGALMASLTACQKQDAAADAKGPAEKAGQQIDQATAKAGQELNKFAEKAGEKMQEAGKKIQQEATEVQNNKKE
jgi:hypothetical protein